MNRKHLLGSNFSPKDIVIGNVLDVEANMFYSLIPGGGWLPLSLALQSHEHVHEILYAHVGMDLFLYLSCTLL